MKATGCNAATRAINAYLHWSSGATGKCGGGCHHPHVKPMKEPEFVPTVFTDDQIKKLVRFSGLRFFEPPVLECLSNDKCQAYEDFSVSEGLSDVVMRVSLVAVADAPAAAAAATGALSDGGTGGGGTFVPSTT